MGTQYRIPSLASRRQFFRLPYPVMCNATLDIDGTNYKVGEISEKGLRVLSSVGRFTLESCVSGMLTLAMGSRCPVTGKVLRIDNDCVVLQLERGPTSQDVIKEQRFVAKIFPDWKPQSV